VFFFSGSALATPFTVYDDALSSSFSDQSIQLVPNYASTSSPYAGTHCISALLSKNTIFEVGDNGTPDISQYGGVDFWYRTNASTMTLSVALGDGTQTVGNAVSLNATTTWTNAHLTLADFGLNSSSGTLKQLQITTNAINTPGVAFDEVTLFDVVVSDGGIDAGSIDAGSIDAGSMDAGPVDAGSVDASAADAEVDASATDAEADASIPADAQADAGKDASTTPDAGTKNDAGKTYDEAGSNGEPTETNGGCSCDVTSIDGGMAGAMPLAIAALALLRRRSTGSRRRT
jgi:hypothetical protein